MGNTNSCVCGLQDVFSFWVSGLRGGEEDGAAEDAPSSSSMHFPAQGGVGDMAEKVMVSSGSVLNADVELQIEQSKSHWSDLTEFDFDSIDKEVEDDNREVFHTLLSHPLWGGTFFSTFGYETEFCYNAGSLMIGEKFAEGGQAELFHAKVIWEDPRGKEWEQEHGLEWALKVFKHGTPLRHLQSQWPHGMLQFRAEEAENWKSPIPKQIPRFFCAVQYGTLLEDGRFAFLMKKEHVDLRTLINHTMMTTRGTNSGPFSSETAEEMMFEVGLGMSWLHSREIVHRDLKASNVLVHIHDNGSFQSFVADYECSIGVVGTGVYRAPEILKACQDRSVSKKPELFTKSSDVYGYGMTCYEILTGKFPFDGHSVNDYADRIINGKRPEVPKYVDGWIHKLLRDCWQFDPLARPSFEEILEIILENSTRIKVLVENGSYALEEMDWTNCRSGVSK